MRPDVRDLLSRYTEWQENLGMSKSLLYNG